MPANAAGGVGTGSPDSAPYGRISAFYFCYFAVLGAMVPYWTLYLASIGYSALQIGYLSALTLGTRIVAPYVWGWWADRRGRTMPIVRVAAVMSTFVFAGVFVPGGFWWMAAVMSLHGFFWNACLPQLEANTMRHLAGAGNRYGRLRLWGSLGFILLVVGGGALIDGVGLALLPTILIAATAAAALVSFAVPEATRDAPRRVGLVARLPNLRQVVLFLLVCNLMQASHGPLYTFFSIYLYDAGYSRSVTGWLWALGVVAEIGVFIWLARTLPRIGVRRLLLASLALAVVRWLITGYFVNYLVVLVAAQVLHGATFGAFHAAAMVGIQQLFPDGLGGRGQALYAGFGYGAGGALGGFYSGYLWDLVGPANTFTAAAAVAALALLIGRRLRLADA